MMEINYWAVLACAVLSMIVGMIWYGPIWGKKWMEINAMKPKDLEARKDMQRRAGSLYLVQFLLTFFQAYVLAYALSGWRINSGVEIALVLCAAFVLPTVAAGAMWNADSARISWARFLIQAGYYLILFVLFGLILTYWQ